MKSKIEEATTRTVRSKYTASFKEQALERAEKDGIPKVAQGFRDCRGNIVCLAGKASANRATL